MPYKNLIPINLILAITAFIGGQGAFASEAPLLEVTVEPVDNAPATLEETKIKVFVLNGSDQDAVLPDRFSGASQTETFQIKIDDMQNKPVIYSYFSRQHFPREAKTRTLKPGKRLIVPITLGKVLYEPKLPTRFFLPKIEEGEDYKLSVVYTIASPETGNIVKRYESEPITIRFKERDVAKYKADSNIILSDPKDLDDYKQADGESEGLQISVSTEDVISKDNDEVEVTFDNTWDENVTLWKVDPSKSNPKDCTLSFIVCRKDGTPVSDQRRIITGQYAASFDTKINAGDSTAFTVKLSDFVSPSVFSRTADYYLIARYENQVGDDCLKGVWYSEPVKVKVEKSGE